MFRVKTTNAGKVFANIEQSIKKASTQLAQNLFEEAKRKTPIRQGRARKGWRVERKGKSISVINRVPYIGTLERGRSTQAPRGILRPTVHSVKNRRKLK